MYQKEKYLKIQQKIRELCINLGLVEIKHGLEIQFRTEEDDSLIWGEVIRLFNLDFDDLNLRTHAIVVFFNKLNYVKTKYSKYSYIYEFNPENQPFKLKNNVISLNKDLDYILNVIEYVVVGALKQRKELLLKLKHDSINKDFDV